MTPGPVENTFFFKNADGHNLYGVSHIPSDCVKIGVLFCHPFGDEKQYSYRTCASLCRRLSQAKIAAFRFDCRGFGDSDGETIEATVTSQLQDINSAIEQFIELSGVGSVLLAGVRFGSVLAAMVAEGNPKVSGLALISPVTNGREFWQQQIRNQQMEYLARSEKPLTTDSVSQELKKNGRIEFEGGWFSAEMIGQIKAINLIDQPARFNGLVGVCASPGQPVDSIIDWYKTAGCRTYIGALIEVPFWNGRTLYNHLEQHGLVNDIVDWVTDINMEQTKC